MGIYGNQLTHFQAQFVDLQTFDMKAKINSGFDTTKDKNDDAAVTQDFRGCFQNITANEVKDNAGNLLTVVSGNLWSDTSLILGNFIKNPDDSFTYRIKKLNSWDREGGFFYYDVIQVAGDDGTFTDDTEFNEGVADLI